MSIEREVRRKAKIHVPRGCLLAVIPAVFISQYVTLEKIHDGPMLNSEIPPVTHVPEGLRGEDLEFFIARHAAPTLVYSRQEQEKEASMDTLWQVSFLEASDVKRYFDADPQANETWVVVTVASVYPEDGGPDRVGKELPFGYALTLTERGIHALSDVNSRIRNGHAGDVEETRVFVRIVNGQMEIMGIENNEHGTWVFTPINEVTFLDGRIVEYVSVKKDTQYPSLKACNRATKKVWGIRWLKDKCAGGIFHLPEILRGRNVGERNNQRDPFVTDPELLEKYQGKEHVWDEEGHVPFYGGKDANEASAWFQWSE